MSTKLGQLNLNIQWIGTDGETTLHSDEDPALIAGVQTGEKNVGWGESVKFDLDPNQTDGTPMNYEDVPGVNTKYPVISWRAWLADSTGAAISTVTALDADPSGRTEGEVDEGGGPVHFGCRPYDQTKGYGLKVICGNKVQGADGKVGYKPASPDTVWCHVYAYETASGLRSNEVKYTVS